jgi:hypothetical protein
MRQIVRIGLEIAKRWFQLHAVDEAEKELFNRKLPATKFWAFSARCRLAKSLSKLFVVAPLGSRDRTAGPSRAIDLAELRQALSQTRQVRRHDARALCETASRPDMRFIRVKTEEQQAALMHDRVEERPNIRVEDPIDPPLPQPVRERVQRIVLSTLRPEPVAEPQEFRLVDRRQDRPQARRSSSVRRIRPQNIDADMIAATAAWTILSSSAPMPSGRRRPSAFGIYRRREASARYPPPCTRA